MPAVSLLVPVLLLVLGSGAARQPGSLEYDVKAAFLYNFAKFVDWPDDAFASPSAPLTLCVVGVDPFGRVLDETVQGEQLDTHPLTVARFAGAPPPGVCHVVFVSLSERPRYAALLAAIDRRRVLTVGDSVAFLDAGGFLAFFLDGGRVRFAANSALAGSLELKVSSKLLRVAMPYEPHLGEPR